MGERVSIESGHGTFHSGLEAELGSLIWSRSESNVLVARAGEHQLYVSRSWNRWYPFDA
jgi:hypothetical protein